MENLENQVPDNEPFVEANEEITLPAADSSETVQLEKGAVEETAADLISDAEAEASAESVVKDSPYADGPYETAVLQEKLVKSKKKCNRPVWLTVLCVIVAAVLVAGSCAITASVLEDRFDARLAQQQEAFRKLLDSVDSTRKPFTDSEKDDSDIKVESVSGTKTPAQVYAENVKSVVMIYCEIVPQQGPQVATGYSTGSGFVVSDDGYVVTNAHVVDGATNIFVTIYDNTEHRATLIGADTANDVALLKIDETDLDYAVIGRSSDLIVGDQVVAIGNPLGELTSTLTVGYISAKERDVSTDGSIINMLQTDAAINSGNSGGPLFNMNGEVVGITTAKYSGTTESGAVIEGIGFAIPIDDVYDLLSDLKDYGYVTGAYLGVSVSDMDSEAANYYGMPVGAYVHEAVPGYCAAAAGVQVKDIIVALGEFEVSNVSELTRVLRNFSAGETTTITVYRGGQKLVLDITLDAKPGGDEQSAQPSFPEEKPEGNFEEWYEYFAPYFDGDGDFEMIEPSFAD